MRQMSWETLEMKTKPNFSAERTAALRSKHAELARATDADRPAIEQEWRDFVQELKDFAARHSAEIDDYRTRHNLGSTAEVLEIAIQRLFAYEA